MGTRHVMIRSQVLAHPHGAVLSQKELGMDDTQIDEFIAAGHGIEHDGGPVETADVSGDGPDEFSDMTKEELYERAKDLDVDRRSTMDRDELEAAVRAGSAPVPTDAGDGGADS